jgi:site-specific DNA recombinase
VRPAEAAEVASACEAVLAGVSLVHIAADLRKRQVLTVTGKPWTAQGIRSILLRPRIAGLATYRGEVLEGVTVEWPAIVDRDVWDAVRVILTDPVRRTTPGNTPRWLGSGLYRCGHPDCIDADPPRTLRVGSGQVEGSAASP